MSRHCLCRLLLVCQVFRGWWRRRAWITPNCHYLPWTYRLEHGHVDFALLDLSFPRTMRRSILTLVWG